MFSERVTKGVIAFTLPQHNAWGFWRGKVRPNIIQIEMLEISILWDLDDDEEISTIVDPQNFQIETYVNTGHIHFVESKYGLRPISASLNQNLYCVFDTKSSLPVLFSVTTFLDILQVMTIHNFSQNGIPVQDVDPYALVSNYSGRTFFSLFSERHDLIKLVSDQIKNNEYSPETREWSEIQERIDHVFIRQLYYILKLPVNFGRQPDKKSLAALHLKLVSSDCLADHEEKESILVYGLHKDSVLFNPIVELFMISNDVRATDLIATFGDFCKLFELRGSTRDRFLDRSKIRTDSCSRVTALLSNPD